MKSIELHIRNDIEMPLGKIIAQASHALGLKFIQQCRLVKEYKDAITIQSELNEIVDFSYSKFIKINWVSERDIESLTDASIITDSGRTVFNEPTITCAATSNHTRKPTFCLPHQSDTMPFKQGIFINRKAVSDCKIERDELIIQCAVSSLKTLINKFDLNGEATLQKSEATYIWLTHLFGKTVVGSKKPNEYETVLRNVELKASIVAINYQSHNIGFACTPIESNEIEKYTKHKSFRLLD
ncbi:peptidyl-tRNA hydrolase [Vibrio owensii]|uniref:peptidyl-tRNA hydrolase n=1 Tax=Vibrio owensii TaxID=696485 RepID=UPI0018F1F0BA|nr:peptidyl-tRNA hydrolase [Vibrio owensii]